MNRTYYRTLMICIAIFLISIGTYVGLKIADNITSQEVNNDPIGNKVELYQEGTSSVTSNSSLDVEMKKILEYEQCEEKVVETFVEYGTTMEKIREKYAGEYQIEQIDKTSVTITKKIENNCPNHFLLKILNDTVVIYQIGEEDKTTLYKSTEISKDSLREEMKKELEKGIRVNSLNELNQLIEDMES